jgi:hypothetical protein
MKLAVIALGLSLIFGAAPRAARAADGSCVSCHRGVKDSAGLRRNFSDWKTSVHAKSGIGCESCHGGNPAKAEKAEAHAGMTASTDAKSSVYYTRIPETCGKCHEPEFAAFKKSAHFKELESSGRGPNCVTCHGAMANHVIDPESMQMTCSLCHHQPGTAYEARATIAAAQDSLRRLNGEIRSARSSGLTDPAEQEKTYRALVDRLHQAKVDWHSFQVERVLAQAKDVSQKANAAFTELKSKNKNP